MRSVRTIYTALMVLLAKATEVAIGDLGIIPSHYQLNVWATRKGLKIVPWTDEYTMVMGVSAQ